MTEIAGKVALVTGGGSGIGCGLVLELAKQGASVVVADIVKERAEEVAATVQEDGGKAVAVGCDVSDRQSVRQMKAEANEAFGTVSLVFANAGVTWFDRLTNMEDGDIDWIFQVNLMGTVHCMQVFLPDMIAAREGHVIATASQAGLNSGWVPYHVPYSSAKAGIIGMMLNLRIELNEVNVGSTIYCPGGTGGSGLTQGRIGESIHFRPEKFGGPATDVDPAELMQAMGPNWTKENIIGHFTPEEVAPHVLNAVRNNDAIVLDHSNYRDHFYKYQVEPTIAAFDAAEKAGL